MTLRIRPYAPCRQQSFMKPRSFARGSLERNLCQSPRAKLQRTCADGGPASAINFGCEALLVNVLAVARLDSLGKRRRRICDQCVDRQFDSDIPGGSPVWFHLCAPRHGDRVFSFS